MSERVTTGSEPTEPITVTLSRPAAEWLFEFAGARSAREAESGEVYEKVGNALTGVVEPGHDEQPEATEEQLRSRLREAEARRNEYRERAHKAEDALLSVEVEAEARAERLEAELKEAGDTFSELEIYLHTDDGETHNAEACGVDACIFCLAEARAGKARDRARGVLEKGDTGS